MNRFNYKKINFDRYQIKDIDGHIFCEFLMDIDGSFRFFFPIDSVYDHRKGINQEELEEILNKLKNINYEIGNI
jgi:hypothetical protein